jgi:hypothetical protein
MVTVTGEAKTHSANGIGAVAEGGGQITIDGTISVPAGATYVQVGTTNKTKEQTTSPTTKTGYLTYTDGANTVWVKGEASAGNVCEIGSTGYATLAAALAAHTNGQTIRLLENINHTTQIAIIGKSITFDTNGKTLNVNTTIIALVAQNGGQVNLTGSGKLNVTSSTGEGVFTHGNGSKVVVSNATATGSNRAGAFAAEGGEITVLETATGSGTDGLGAYAGTGGKITVENASGGSFGVRASGSGASIAVRNATATGNSGIGAYASNGGSVTVAGDARTTGATGIGAVAGGGSQITIDGTLTVPAGATYIIVGSIYKTKEQMNFPTSKTGYLTYTDGQNTVWVKGDAPATPPPTITQQPANRTIDAGQNTTFAITATGAGAISCRWLISTNGVSWSLLLQDDIYLSGTSSATLTVTKATQMFNGFKFRCEATNAGGSVLSDIATLTVNTPPAAPTIDSHPVSQTVTEGQNATFTLSAPGAATCQWYVAVDGGILQPITNGGVYSGATTPTLTLTSVPLSFDGYIFGCMAYNAAGIGRGTDLATLTVTPAGTTTLTLSVAELEFDLSASSLPFDVASNADWTATATAAWLTLSPASGSGAGTVPATVAENRTGATRTATITVTAAGITRTIAVTQSNTSVGNELIDSPFEGGRGMLKAWMQNGVLYVSGLQPGKPWQIYSLTGVLIYQKIASGETDNYPSLQNRGICIVTDGKSSVKVIM